MLFVAECPKDSIDDTNLCFTKANTESLYRIHCINKVVAVILQRKASNKKIPTKQKNIKMELKISIILSDTNLVYKMKSKHFQ